MPDYNTQSYACNYPCAQMDDPQVMPFRQFGMTPFGQFGMMPFGFGQQFHHFHHHFFHPFFPFGFGFSPFGFGEFNEFPFGF